MLKNYLKQIADKCPKDDKLFADEHYCGNCEYRGTMWISNKKDMHRVTVQCKFEK